MFDKLLNGVDWLTSRISPIDRAVDALAGKLVPNVTALADTCECSPDLCECTYTAANNTTRIKYDQYYIISGGRCGCGCPTVYTGNAC